jgi:tRNA(Arg) A34 adenosine deaminase TadA
MSVLEPMQHALLEARNAVLRQEVPVGAVITDANGRIIAASGNEVLHHRDATAHAEMVVIRKASSILGNERLTDCDIYVTLEPCPMCASAISMARIRRLYFGAYDIKSGGVEHGARVFDATSCHHKPEVYGGICEKEASTLLKDFFKEKR